VEEVGPGVSDLVRGDHVVMVSCQLWALPALRGRPAALCEPGAAPRCGTLLSGARRLSRNERRFTTIWLLGLRRVRNGVATLPGEDRPELPLAEAALFGCAVLTGVGAVLNTAKVRRGRRLRGRAWWGRPGIAPRREPRRRATDRRIDLADDKLALAANWGDRYGQRRDPTPSNR